ncbi:MAG: TIGR04255 family protein [Nitrospirae bacterium]|nr:TIGR04255 family protein [Nitrospirota bacterium]
MSEYPVFPKAPIAEALLDIRVDLPEETDLATLETLHDILKNRFPEKTQRVLFTAGFQATAGEPPTVVPPSSQPYGFFFRSPHDNKIVQARLDGFTFNKLRPYSNWDDFRSEARDLWNLYVERTHPIRITRIALRYINRIDIPLPIRALREYLLTVPEVAPNLPQDLDSSFLRLTMRKPDIEATAIITQALEAAPEGRHVPLIFDIDVFNSTHFANNKDDIWDEFEKLRVFKNDIFFRSLTPRTKEMFK